MQTTERLAPWHPGEIIKEDFLTDYGLTQATLAKRLHIPASRLTEIIKGRRSVTADTALRLARFFGNSPDFWLGLQAAHDLAKADTAAIAQQVAPIRAA